MYEEQKARAILETQRFIWFQRRTQQLQCGSILDGNWMIISLVCRNKLGQFAETARFEIVTCLPMWWECLFNGAQTIKVKEEVGWWSPSETTNWGEVLLNVVFMAESFTWRLLCTLKLLIRCRKNQETRRGSVYKVWFVNSDLPVCDVWLCSLLESHLQLSRTHVCPHNWSKVFRQELCALTRATTHIQSQLKGTTSLGKLSCIY